MCNRFFPRRLFRLIAQYQPVHALVIRPVPPALQHIEQLAETIGGIAFSGALKRRNHRFIPGGIWPIPVYKITDPSDSASSANADAVSLLKAVHQFSSNGCLYSFSRSHPSAVRDRGSAQHASASACGFRLPARTVYGEVN